MLAGNNTVFQFFVKASDLGDPAMVNTVSTQIQIIEKDDRPPRFAESTKLIFVHENEPVIMQGHVVEGRVGGKLN